MSAGWPSVPRLGPAARAAAWSSQASPCRRDAQGTAPGLVRVATIIAVGGVAGDDWAQATLGALMDKGLRNGGARRAVVELLGEQDCCLSAQEIFDRLRLSGRTVGIASVY